MSNQFNKHKQVQACSQLLLNHILDKDPNKYVKKIKKQNKTVQQVLPWSGMKSASSEFHLHIVIDSIETDKINTENTVN